MFKGVVAPQFLPTSISAFKGTPSKNLYFLEGRTTIISCISSDASLIFSGVSSISQIKLSWTVTTTLPPIPGISSVSVMTEFKQISEAVL